MPNVDVSDPTLDPEFFQSVVEEIIEYGKSLAPLMLRSMYPKGYGWGEVPETNRILRYVDLMLKSEKLTEIAASDQSVPGDAQRAQQELFELETLRQEFADAQG